VVKQMTAAGVPDGDVDKMTHANAMRIFQFDPFANRAKEDCTVAALRAESPDVELVTRSPRQKKSKADLSEFASAVEKMMTSGGD
jgi:hypothetical protein